MIAGERCGFDLETDAAGVLRLRFNRPERLNVMSRATKRDLIETLLQAQMDDDVRVVLFSSTGRAFIAGDDLDRARQDAERPTLVEPLPYKGSFPLRTYESLRGLSQQVTVTLLNMDKLTVCALNGVAVQSGLSLALCCDFRLASTSARLGSGTLRYGYLPDEGGHWLLVRILGLPAATDFVLRKKIVSADEALRLGLVTEVVEPDDLDAAALDLARELATGPQVASRLVKRALVNALTMSLEQSLDDIATKTAIADHHADAHEGARAFAERRPARFNAWLDPTAD